MGQYKTACSVSVKKPSTKQWTNCKYEMTQTNESCHALGYEGIWVEFRSRFNFFGCKENKRETLTGMGSLLV